MNRKNAKEITTDRLNSQTHYTNLGPFRFLLPQSSRINLGSTIEINGIKSTSKRISGDLQQILEATVKSMAFCGGVLVSGGIDSAVLAALLLNFNKDAKAIVCGYPDSDDVRCAAELAYELEAELLTCNLNDKTLIRSLRTLKASGLNTYDAILGVVEFNALIYAKNFGISAVLSGLGADELFFGFSSHRSVPRSELKNFMSMRLAYIHVSDILRINTVSKLSHVSVITPYLSDNVIDFARSVDIERMENPYGKENLRALGRSLGLGPKITERGKRAMQYGSGVVKNLKRIAKEKGFNNTAEFIKSI